MTPHSILGGPYRDKWGFLLGAGVPEELTTVVFHLHGPHECPTPGCFPVSQWDVWWL